MMFCCGCAETKLIGSFSNSQLRKKEKPRCGGCIKDSCSLRAHGIRSVPVHCMPAALYRRCAGGENYVCKHGWQPLTEFNGAAFACNSCVSADASAASSQILEHENAARRTAAAGACKVKDVKIRYDHLCEIPLHCYVSRGVASDLNDYVTEADIEAASSQWDAEGIAEEVDKLKYGQNMSKQ